MMAAIATFGGFPAFVIALYFAFISGLKDTILNDPPEVRRLIYTTNAFEALNSKIRRAVRTRGHFPSEEAAAKLIYLALNASSQEWKRSVREWHAVKSQLAIMFQERFPMA